MGITTLVVVVFILVEYVFRQTSWPDHENRTTVSLEWDSPQFGTDFMGRIRTTQLTSVGYLNARIRLNDNMFILAEVPVSYYGWKFDGDRSSLSNKNMELGSPYFGTEIRANAGISRLLNESKVRVLFSTGLIRNIYRGEWAEILDPETNLTYSAYISYSSEGYKVHTVLYGRSPIGISGLDFKEDTLMQFRAGLGRDFGIVNMGGYFRVPLTNKHIYNVKFSYGLNLAISI